MMGGKVFGKIVNVKYVGKTFLSKEDIYLAIHFPNKKDIHAKT